ncbi:hypothetical protein [Nocardioides montaniterrae]
MPLVLLVLLTVSLAGCGGTSGSTDVVVARAAAPLTGTERTLVLPTGTLHITLGEPTGSVSTSASHDGQRHEPPAGSTYVPVGLSLDAAAAPWGGRLAVSAQETQVAVSFSGTVRTLGSPYRVQGVALRPASVTSWYVALPHGAEAARIDVTATYAGQTLDAPAHGPASAPERALRALVRTPARAVRCPFAAEQPAAGGRVATICGKLSVVRTPYWPGRGWAPRSEPWTAVLVARLGATTFTQGGATYTVDKVGGWVGRTALTGTTYPDSVDGVVVLENAERAAIRLRMRGTLEHGRGPVTAELMVQRPLDLLVT